MTDTERLEAVEAEMSVLGAMLNDRDAVPLATELVGRDDFNSTANQILFATLVHLWEAGTEIDPITVVERLKSTAELDAVGGSAAIAQLVDIVPTAANISYHAKIVRDKSARRRLVKRATEIMRLPHTAAEADADELFARAQQMLTDAAPQATGKGLVHAKEEIMPVLAVLERVVDGKQAVGLKSGIADLDRILATEPGELVIVAGRPSMGKSALALCNIAAHNATEEGKRVAVFQIEGTRRKSIERLMGSLGRVDMHGIRHRKNIQPHEYPQLQTAGSVINGCHLWIDDESVTLHQIRAALYRLRQEAGGVDLVVVDYLQLMDQPGAESRRMAVESISRGLKTLAKEMECVVLAVSQLSRACEARPDKRPMLSDLRETGQIEQDADAVLLVYRPEYYFGESMDLGSGGGKRTINVAGKAEIIVAKQRDGRTETIPASWVKEFTRFEDLDWRHNGKDR